MSNYLLSFCIPTYSNQIRMGALNKLVSSLMNSYGNNELFEIVICDDSQEYNLQMIKYEQIYNNFRYYKNSERKGLINNYIYVLSIATAEYVMPLSDEDEINFEFINYIINILKTKKMNAIFGVVKGGDKKSIWFNWGNRVFESSKESLGSELAFYGHFSGYILKRDKIDFDILLNDINAKNRSHIFPIAPTILTVARSGFFMTVEKDICYCGTFAKKVYEDEQFKKTAIYSPEGRMVMFNLYRNVFIEKIAHNKQEKEDMVIGLYKYFVFILENDIRSRLLLPKDFLYFFKHAKNIDGLAYQIRMHSVISYKITMKWIIWQIRIIIKKAIKNLILLRSL
ncbi:MAG: glycosyltransferase [Spirochaetota bacterium]